MAKKDGENLEEFFSLVGSEEGERDVGESIPQRHLQSRFRGMIFLVAKINFYQRDRMKVWKKLCLKLFGEKTLK